MFDVSIENLWRAWLAFRIGKRRSAATFEFAYSLEHNLFALHTELTQGTYRHGAYRQFTVTDSKRRKISVAPVRDRIVHRLLYEYLVLLFDQRFIYDAWSCRKGKGLLAAIERAQDFAHRFSRAYVWRMDIKKFFDSVHHDTLLKLLTMRNIDPVALALCKTIIESYQTRAGFGIPIGNLTSQVFANIYLNELDRYAMHTIHPLRYMRYGDDALFLMPSQSATDAIRGKVSVFARETLHLTINPKNDIVVPVRRGVKFLGTWIYPHGRRIVTSVRARIGKQLASENVASYSGLVRRHESEREHIKFHWLLYERIIQKS